MPWNIEIYTTPPPSPLGPSFGGCPNNGSTKKIYNDGHNWTIIFFKNEGILAYEFDQKPGLNLSDQLFGQPHIASQISEYMVLY